MNPKDRVGVTKPGLSAMPCPVLFEVGQVLRHGADKYGRHNWRDEDISASVYYDAALRHLMQWWEGEDIDAESGLPHLAHAIAGLMILRDAQKLEKCNDDRPASTHGAGWLRANL